MPHYSPKYDIVLSLLTTSSRTKKDDYPRLPSPAAVITHGLRWSKGQTERPFWHSTTTGYIRHQEAVLQGRHSPNPTISLIESKVFQVKCYPLSLFYEFVL